MSDEREKRLEQDNQESQDTEVEAHKRMRTDADKDEDSFDDVEAHSHRLHPKHDHP